MRAVQRYAVYHAAWFAMLPHDFHLRRLIAPTVAVCALLAGCAGLRCPRIDPTGQQCLVWPGNEVVTPVAGVPGALPPVVGNLQAPPVGTDPFFPQVAAPAITAPAVAAAPAVTPASVAYPQTPQDKLTITPGRVLAPVGSEVVLKASICTTEGYSLANQKVEWMLGRNGVGQFVELGGKGVFHPPLIPWNRGEKVDNYLAHGYTADGPLCITRGTADPTDDVNITRGDAWISVTSPNEGTSHITAYTPAVKSWDERKAAATIYWVDVQWTFPPPSITSSGRGEALTTVVNRQTDGTPIEGWIVRYEVADGGALAGGSGSVSEVRTGADGRASVQVAPTAAGAASSQINVQLIRPANFGGSEAPQLVVGSGTSFINWASGSQPYVPPTTAQPLPTSPPMQTSPSPPIQQAPITPPPSLPVTGRPRLELTIQGTQQASVGGSAPIRITIRNLGDAPATGVVLNDRFDAGLTFPAKPRSEQIEKPIASLAPGGTFEEDLLFEVTKGGRLCHTVTVSCAESSPISKSHCITAVVAAPQREGNMTVAIDGPAEGVAGQTVVFNVTVKNTGQTALMNIVAEEEYPPATLTPQPTEPNVQVVSGKITRQIPRLEVGQQATFNVPCVCRQATRTTVLLRARAETDPPTRPIETADDHSIEIQPARGQPPVGAAPAQPAATGLSAVITFINRTVLVDSRVVAQVTVTNKSSVPDEAVALRIIFPPNLTPDPLGAQGPPGVPAPEVRGDELVFSPLATLAPNETAHYMIPLRPTLYGIVPVTAQAVSRNVPQGAAQTVELEILDNRR